MSFLPRDGGGKLILVGRVAGAFGVKGEVRLTAYTEDPLNLLRYRILRREDGAAALTLQSGRAAGDGLVARAAEVASKEAADALRGLHLYVSREALPPPDEEDEFYQADLIGLDCETTGGEALGKVKAVHDFGAGDILEIDPGQGRATLYLPFTRAAVPTVDLAGGRIIASPPAQAEDDAAPEADAKG